MSLIALWSDGGYEFLLADFLISRDEVPRPSHVRLPSGADVATLLADWDVELCGLSQKIWIISPSLAVAWAGARITAQTVLREMQQRFGGGATVQDLETYFRGVGHLSPPCTLIGWVVEGADCIGFKWNSDATPAVLKAPLAAGTGETYLEALFTPTVGGGPGGPLEKTLSKLAKLLGEEIYSGTSLWSRFGGGFQLAYRHGGDFQHLGSVTYVFLRAHIHANGDVGFTQPDRILKSALNGIIIQLLALDTSQAGEEAPAPKQMFYIPPIDASGTFQVDSNMSLLSAHNTICILVLKEDDPIGLFAVCDSPGGPELLKVVHAAGSRERLAINGGAFDAVIKGLRATRLIPPATPPARP